MIEVPARLANIRGEAVVEVLDDVIVERIIRKLVPDVLITADAEADVIYELYISSPALSLIAETVDAVT